jgi:acetoin utilization protein AcuB
MLSDRDLLRDALAQRTGEVKPATRVGQLMATRVLTARPEAGIRQVARILFEERIGAMPIVDAEGALVGILTRSDVLRAVLTSGPLELWI